MQKKQLKRVGENVFQKHILTVLHRLNGNVPKGIFGKLLFTEYLLEEHGALYAHTIKRRRLRKCNNWPMHGEANVCLQFIAEYMVH
jgi:hypothetical protein